MYARKTILNNDKTLQQKKQFTHFRIAIVTNNKLHLKKNN